MNTNNFNNSSQDPVSIGHGLSASNASWTFGDNVPQHFEEHIRQSVPFYQEGHNLVAQLSDFFIQKDSYAYDLGCSTGALIFQLSQRHRKSCQWIGMDCGPKMIEQAKLNWSEKYQDLENIDFLVDDIVLAQFLKNDLTVAYYTLQFIPPRFRQNLIDKIYSALNWGGAFIVFEKVRGPDARFQDILTSLYTDFKLKSGFSPEEIIAKSRSLKGVLEPFSTEGNLGLLQRAGFSDIMCIFKYLCFEGYVCIK